MVRRYVLSIVIPCYNEEEMIPLFMNNITNVSLQMPEVDFEYIFVDDGSTDRTLEILRHTSKKNNRVKFYSFSRNFGKEAALLAGLEASTGDFVAVMDVDLQDPPELLPTMFAAIKDENYDCVATRRITRKGEPPIRSFFARRFYRLINKISDTQIVDGARDFRLMTRQMADAILSLKEYNRFSKGLFSWIGFNTKWIEFENTPRMAGNSKWSFWKLFFYSLDGIIAFSTKPLAISSLFGILFCFFALFGILFLIVRYLLFGDPVTGWASIVTIILFVGGIQLFCIGVLGQYLAKTYMEGKHRPIFIIKESSDDEKQKSEL